jgi:PAS domain S-box-containing protein
MSALPAPDQSPASAPETAPAPDADTTLAGRQARLAQVTAAALAVSSAEGPAVFEQLTRALAQVLGVDAAMIVAAIPGRTGVMHALGTWVDGKNLRPFDYDIEHSPCREMAGRESRYAVGGVHPEFAVGSLFHAKGMDSYAARALVDGRGNQLGLVAVLHRVALPDRETTETLLQIFAVRAAAEIERNRAQRAVETSEESYRAIFDAAEDAIFVHDWDSSAILDVSAKATNLFGYARDELLRLRVGDLSLDQPPYTEREAAAMIQRAKVHGQPLRFDWRARHRDGRLMWHEVTLKRALIGGEPRVLAFVRDVTDRKAAEDGLRASEEQYRAIFEAATDSLQLLDASHRVVDVNRAYERMYGKRRADVVGKGLDDLVPAEFRAERLALVKRALAGEVAEIQTTGRRGDGTVFDMEVRCIPFEHHGQRHVLGIARDISERRRAERELRVSEEQYRAIFNASEDSLVLWNAQYEVVDVNDAFLRQYGYTRAEAIGRGYPAELPPEYVADRLDLVRRALAGETCEKVARAFRKDGSSFAVELRVFPFEHRGEPHVLAIARDVTERQRAIAERQAAEAALRDSEEQYRAIFNASADGLLLRDAQFRIVDVNPAYLAMKGFAREELVGSALGQSQAGLDDAVRRAIHGRVLGGEIARFETNALRKGGSFIEVEVRGMPVRYHGQLHALYSVRDISARRHAEAERATLEGQLRQAQKMEAIGQLTGGIAHDFNNILASIMGYVVLAAERPGAEADARLAEHLEQALASCRRARDLIQQMLAFSRTRRGAAQTLVPGAIVREVAQLLRVTLPSSLVFDVDPGDPALAVTLDPVQAQQALLNLCINARDALGGSGRLALGVEAQEAAHAVCASCGKAFSGRFVALTVRDDGPGIPPAVRERMFEPFFSTKAPGKGTGMGLATVHRVVHEHGGHVMVATEPGRGTRFDVLLPAAAGTAPDDAADPARAATRRTPRFSGRVLLADDESSVLNVMREMLTNWGLDVTSVADGSAAHELLVRDPDAFDLLITDQTMPGMTGIELTAAAHALRAQLPVILYSGNLGEIEAQQQRLGLCRVLCKPVEPGELREALAHCLQVPAG